MKIILLLVAIMLLVAGGAEARYSPGLEIAEGENITLDGGFITGQSTDMYVSPMTFGAVGDGVTDDIDALADTIVYARENNLSVLLPMRTFRTTRPLNLTTGDIVYGIRGSFASPQDGYNVNGSMILYDGSDCAINITSLDGDYLYKVVLRDLVVESANNQQNVGVKCAKLSEFEFSNLDIREFDTNIYADDLTIGSVRNVHFNGAITALNLNNSGRISIENCNFWNNTIGIRARALYSATIRENQFEQNKYSIWSNSDGIDATSDSVSISDNNFRSSTTQYAGTDIFNGIDARVLVINDTETAPIDTDSWEFSHNSVYYTGVDYLINFSLHSDSSASLSISNNRFSGQNLTVMGSNISRPIYTTWTGNHLVGGTGIATGANLFVAGLSENLYDYQSFYGGMQLPVDKEVWHDGCIWYDSASDTVKVRSNGINKVLAFVT